MALAYRDKSEAGAGGAATTSVTLAPPAGVVAGDPMIALIGTLGGPDVPAPAGWARVGYQERVSGGSFATAWVFLRIADAADEAGTSSYVFAMSPALSTRMVGAIYAASGGSPVDPIVGFASAGSTSTGTTATAPAVTTSVASTLSLTLVVATSVSGAVPTFTPAAGTERVDFGAGASTAIEIFEDTSDPNASRSTTISTASSWAAFQVVLGPRYWETPNAAVNVAPVGGVSKVVDDDIDLVHVHSHPDSGDTQSAAEHRWRYVGDTSWTTESIAGAGTTATIAGGTLVAGTVEHQPRSASSLGNWGPWGNVETFEAIATPAPPVIVTPADDSTVGPSVTVEITGAWTATQIEWRRVADDGAGSPDTGTTYDSDTIIGNERTWEQTFDVTGRDEHYQVRAEVSGSFTDWASNLLHVAYTAPLEPSHTATADASDGTIDIVIANPVPTRPNVITTSTDSDGAGGCNQKRIAVLSTGRVVRVVGDTTTNAKFFWSDDDFDTATDYAADIAGWDNGSLVAYVDAGGIERLVAVWKQSGTGGGRTSGLNYLMVGTLNTARTTVTWGTAVSFNNLEAFCDLAVVAEGTGAKVFTIGSQVSGGAETDIRAATINSSGALSSITGVASSSFGGAVHSYPSICVDPATKTFYAAYSAGTTGAGKGIRFRRATYAAGVWTWQTEREIDNTRYIDTIARWIKCLWDGTRVVIVGEVYDGANYDLIAHERDAADTTTTTRELAGNLAAGDRLDYGGCAVDPTTGDLYVVAGNTGFGGNSVVYRKWTRATTTLGAAVEIEDTSNTKPYAHALWSAGDLLVTYTARAASPFDVMFASVFDLDVAEDVDHNNVWRREVGDATPGIRIGADVDPDGTYTDVSPGSRSVYEYRVEAVAANGASAFDDWSTT